MTAGPLATIRQAGWGAGEARLKSLEILALECRGAGIVDGDRHAQGPAGQRRLSVCGRGICIILPAITFCYAVFALVSFSHSPTEGSRPRASRCSKRAWLLPALSGVSRVPWALPPKESNEEALPSTRRTGRREQGQHVCALCATVASREAVVKAPWIPLGHRRCPQSAWRRMRLERCSATCVSRCTHR